MAVLKADAYGHGAVTLAPVALNNGADSIGVSTIEEGLELRQNGVNGTNALNTHSLVRLIVAQMAYLAYGTFDCGAGNLWHRAYQLAEIETGRHPLLDRPLEPGEKERILAVWEKEER